MRPYMSYIVCATQRSGSTLLCESLSATGIAGHPDEYFDALKSTGVPRRPLEYFTGVEDEELLDILQGFRPDEEQRQPPPGMSYEAYLEWAVRCSTSPNGVCGTKLMWGYFPDFISKVRDIPRFHGLSTLDVLATLFPHPRYIYVTRHDKLSQAISLWKALQTWAWRKEDGQEDTFAQGREPRFHFGAIHHLINILEDYERGWRQFFATNHLHPLTVTYEELTTDHEATMRRVFDYLEIPAPPDLSAARPRTRRQADELSLLWAQRYKERLAS
ncbi:MAG TPA: Stf0 family sulfotransferase [Ktedonobacteraceae bacterium]|jgi:LPS sulfotransferase NodH|nr:Stf0 family sulfotransferase [Ktedonobacteraceae bacterium]